MVADECQHYPIEEMKFVKQCARKCTKAIFLSDASQSERRVVEFPFHTQRIELKYVARSSERIVKGSAPFRAHTGVSMNGTTHAVRGPPLVPTLFEAQPDAPLGAQYAHFVLKAVNDIVETYFKSELKVDHQVAIVVHGSKFREELFDALSMLDGPEGKRQRRRYEFVSATEATRAVFTKETPHIPEIVLDDIRNLDGQEFMAVVVVGVDVSKTNLVGFQLASSFIYRAMTRAQMILHVVNEWIEDGWFGYLANTEYNEEMQSDLQEYLTDCSNVKMLESAQEAAKVENVKGAMAEGGIVVSEKEIKEAMDEHNSDVTKVLEGFKERHRELDEQLSVVSEGAVTHGKYESSALDAKKIGCAKGGKNRNGTQSEYMGISAKTVRRGPR